MATSTEFYLVAGNLNTYAHDKIANHLKRDYERQIGKWRTYSETMAEAQVDAVQGVAEAQKKAFADLEAARQAAAGFAMLALGTTRRHPAFSTVRPGAAVRIEYSTPPPVM